MSNKEPTTLSQQRVVRVFVSSTFQDMFAEREKLVKFTFPELRKRCRERQVEFVEVDLRWGITDEQKAEGKVLPICLAEIERCRPYFIGLLGERYGWVPEKIDEELAEIQQWLKEHKDKSVTELEIIHGVLQNPDMERLSFFYFRDPEKSKEVERELSRKKDYQPEPEASHAKLKLLKEKILKHENNYPVPVRKDVPNAKKLEEIVLEDLWKVIDERFPVEKVPSPLERERMEHEAFAAARRKVYIGREEYFERLDEHVANDSPPLVLLGESGTGKSALIANWVKRYIENHPDEFMIMHFIGSTPNSADYVRILRRIMEEIKERYEPKEKEGDPSLSPLAKGGIEGGDDIPTDPKKLVEAFPLWLAKAAAKGKFILILDALNQLEDKDNAPDLGWLPVYFPANIRVILSTLPGRSLEALKKRDWPTTNVQPIKIDERKRFINDYLEQYRRKLSNVRVDHIASAEQSSNPLYLRTLLEELRVFGIHEELENRINHYLTAEKVDDLFGLVLERLESDYEREKETKGLVKNVMSLLWASRRGLSETELLELLGSNSAPLQRVYWSPLYLAAEDSLVSRSGLLTFFHDFLRKAVEDRYLSSAELQTIAYLRVADYFEVRALDDRKVEELPWQLKEAAEWQRLKDCITSLEMLRAMVDRDKWYELLGYWLLLARRYDMRTSYESALEKFEASQPSVPDLIEALSNVASLLDLCGKYDDAEPFFRRSLAICEKSLGPEHPLTLGALHSLASLLDSSGNYDEAESLFRRVLHLREKVLGPEHSDTSSTMNFLAWVLRSKGNYDEAESLFRRALHIREKVLGRGHPSTAGSLNNLAALLWSKGHYDEAEILCRRSLKIWENVIGPEHPDTALSLNDLANLLFNRKDYEGGESLLERSLLIWAKALGPDHPRTALASHNLAVLLLDKGDYNRAESLFRAALTAWEKSLGPEHPHTASCLRSLSHLLHIKGDNQGAESLARRALAINEKFLGTEHPETGGILHLLAYILHDKGDHDNAELLYRKAVTIREKILGPEHPETALSINNLANLLEEKGNYTEAEGLYRRALAINEKVLGQNHPDTARSWHNLACLLGNMGHYKEAEALSRRALVVWENTLGLEHIDTAKCISGLARVLQELGDYEQAESLFRRALVVKDNTLGSEHPETARSLNDLAVFLEKQGDYKASEILCRKALAIREKVKGPEHPETADSLYCLSSLLERKGEIKEAEILCRKALSMWGKLLGEEHPKISLGLDKLGSILEAGGDYEEAKHLYRRALGIKEKVLGPDHLDTLKTLGNLLQIALRYRDHGDPARAAELFRLVLGTYEKTNDSVREKMPDIIVTMATCHNELAFHTEVPAKHWKEAEYHYRQGIDLFKKAGDVINAANVELNLLTMYLLAGTDNGEKWPKVDIDRVKELTRILEEAGDKRAEKGHKLLKSLEGS